MNLSQIYWGVTGRAGNRSLPPYYAFNHIMRVYGNRGNGLLNRLLRQIFIFYEEPLQKIIYDAQDFLSQALIRHLVHLGIGAARKLLVDEYT